ncbi:interaptin-like [Danaus plexippus]|uniref:interaptin-like n=1 Tax=Danaus plexippus TaxID=13037 RepID=UPI002AAF1C62|nr:interaptin-like [Danaus plexippus]
MKPPSVQWIHRAGIGPIALQGKDLQQCRDRVPVYQGDFIESSVNKLPLGTKRERKSVFPDTSDLSLEHGIEGSSIYNSQKANNGVSRNFKKPIVIKKKFGYHIYRDSDEEMAHSEPGEKCREKVKFKLCDHEPVVGTKSGVKSSCMKMQKADNDIENSIRMAKEAMEFVQRDLKKMQIFTPKMGNTNIEDVETNSDLHHDIEVAREALEHIEDNLESMDYQVTKEKNLELPKTVDEESITKWKEAINNIQRNFEIVKNIEDAFKSDNYHSLPVIDSIKKENSREAELLEDNEKVHTQFIKDNSENIAELYINPVSREVFGISEQKSKIDSDVSMEKNSNMFTSPTITMEENMLLHSDSLKSEINSKNARSEESKDNSENTFKFADSLPTLSEDLELEKIPSESTDDNHEKSPKEAIQFWSSIEKQEPESEQIRKFDPHLEIQRSVLPEKELKTVEETLEHQMDPTEAVKSHHHTVDNYKAYNLKSDDHVNYGNLENSKDNFMAKSSVIEASEKEKDALMIPEQGDIETEKNDKKSEDSRAVMFSSNEFLEKSSQLDNDHLETAKEEMELPTSLKEKQLDQDKSLLNQPELAVGSFEHKDSDHMRISTSESDNDQSATQFKSMAETENSYYLSDPIDRLRHNSETPKTSLHTLNSKEVSEKEDEILEQMKAVSEIQSEEMGSSKKLDTDENILNYETKLRSQNQDENYANVIKTLSDTYPEESHMLKSVSDQMISIPSDDIEMSNNQHYLKENEDNMRISVNQNEKVHVDRNPEVNDHQSISSNIENHFEDYETRNSMQKHHDVLTNLSDKDKMRLSQDQDRKFDLNGKQETHNQITMNSDDKKQLADTLQISKSASELHDEEILSMPSDEPRMTGENSAFIDEENMRLSQNQNDKLRIEENHSLPMPLTSESEKENQPEDLAGSKKISLLPKSVLEPNVDAIIPKKLEETENTNKQRTLMNEEDSMRWSENQNDILKLNENDNQNTQDLSSISSEKKEAIEEYNALDLPKSVSELHTDKTVAMPSDKVEKIYEDDSLKWTKEEGQLRQSEIRDVQINENHDLQVSEVDIEKQQQDHISQLTKSVPEIAVDKTISIPTDKTEENNDHFLKEDENKMRFSQNQHEKLHMNENNELKDHLTMSSDVEKHSEDQNAPQLLKSAHEFNFDDLVSSPSDKIEEAVEQQSLQKQENMRISESQNDKIDIDKNHQTHVPLTTSLDIGEQIKDQSLHLAKSVLDFHVAEGVLSPLDEIEKSDEQHLKQKEGSMRLSENKNDELTLNTKQENYHLDSTISDTKNYFEDSNTKQLQLPKSVPELRIDDIVSVSSDKVEMTKEQNSLKQNNDKMKFAENQNDLITLNEKHELHDFLLNSPENQEELNHHISQLSKSVPEIQVNQMIQLQADKDQTTDDRQPLKDKEVIMRLSENENSKIEVNEEQDIQNSLKNNLDSDTITEDHTMQLLKSVPETQGDKAMSMTSEQLAITKTQDALPEESGKKMSGNENEIIKLNESPDTHIKLSPDNISDKHKFQVKSNADLHNDDMMSMPTNKVENANIRLSHNQYDEQRWNLNNHAIPIDTAQTFKSLNEFDSKEIQTMKFDKVQSQNEDFHLKNQGFMRFPQNLNEKGFLNINDPKMNSGLNSETWSRTNNAEYPLDDQTYVALTKDQISHKNYNPNLQTPKEKQQLNLNTYKSMPEYRIVPSMNTFEFNERQKALNERMNMRINSENLGSEHLEHQHFHNSYALPWDTEKQLQDDFQKTYKSSSDIATSKNSEYEDEQNIPGEVANARNIQDYETRPLVDNHHLDDTQAMRWVQSKQHNNHFSNFYKTTPEIHQEYDFNPHFRNHFHRVAPKQEFGDQDTHGHDYPSMRSRLHDHMLMYHQGKPSDIDSSIESSMRMNMREPFTKSVKDFGFHNQYFSHPSGVARFGTALPLSGAGTGAVGVFPTANSGGCGIPLLLSCSPSVVSGSLAKSHITGSAFKSQDENGMYYTNMKREAMNIDDVPVMKIQKSHNHNQVPVHVHD